MQHRTPSQLEMDGVPSYSIGMHGVSTHRMGHLYIPVWCKDADSVLIAMNLINNYQQPKTEPKRWTVADQQAGRLPEVGCKVATIRNFDCTVVGVDEERKNIAIQYENGKLDVVRVHCVSPIETQAEKAQRFPDVGCRVNFCHKLNTNWRTGEIKYIDDQVAVIKADAIDRPFVYEVDRVEFKPIESPEVKAARLREEWCSNALDSASILSGMREYELKRLGGYIGNIYDALLSGDLPVPAKGE